MVKTTIPIYRGLFCVLITSDENEVKKYYPEFEGELYAHSILTEVSDRQAFLCILNFDASRSVTHGCIAHEATHIAHMILEQRGVIADFINDEPVAYLVEWITDNIYAACANFKVETTAKYKKR